MHRPGHGTLAFAAAAAAAAALILSLNHGFSFWYDEWWFITQRIPWNPHSFLEPYQEHLSIVPVLVYKLLLSTAGLGNYLPFRIVGVIGYIASVAVVFTYARRRIGDIGALALSAPLLVLGAGAQDVLWPFQISFVASVGFGVGALLAFDRGDRRGTVVGAGLIAMALASSAVGVAFAVAAAVDRGLRAPRRALAEVGLPIALYALWYVAYGRSQARLSNAHAVPHWVGSAARSGVEALLRVGHPPSRGVLVLLTGAVAYTIWTRRSARLTALALGAVAFWTMLALGRAHRGGAFTPEVSRYVYVSAVFIAVIVAELCSGVRVRGRYALVVVALSVFAVTMNVRELADRADLFRGVMTGAKLAVTAVTYTDGSAAVNSAALPAGFPPHFPRGYRHALDAYGGTDALTPAQVARIPTAGYSIDALLAQLQPPFRAMPAKSELCTRRLEGLPDHLTRSPILVSTKGRSLSVRVRRFNPTFQYAPGVDVRGNAVVAVRNTGSAAQPPWRVQAASDGPLRVCR